MSRTALCRRCQAPVVMTFAFRKQEFYCLDCGWMGGFFDPLPATDETDDLHARTDAILAEWKTLSEGLIGEGAMLSACPTCMSVHEPHWLHATPEEVAADVTAAVRIRERILEKYR